MSRAKSSKQSSLETGGRSAYDPSTESQAPYHFGNNVQAFNEVMDFPDFENDGMDLSLVHGMFNDEAMQNGSLDSLGAFGNNDTSNASHTSSVDPTTISQFGSGSVGHLVMSQGTSGVGYLPQQRNVGQHSTSVNQQYGQITPPDESVGHVKSGVQAEHTQEDIAKLNRAQRARNAANKRHSKKRKDSPLDETTAVDGEEDDQGAATSVQREKNRVAAAKCRAKKKATSEEMQDVHREGLRANSYLQREVRELRDQKAFLRNALLCHEPGICQCNSIHRFNMAQAQQMAMGVGMLPQAMSPAQDAIHDGSSSMQTPDSETKPGSTTSTQSNRQSFSHGYPQSVMSDSMQSNAQFAEYLNNPSNGNSFS